MQARLTDSQRQLAEENERLAYFVAHRWRNYIRERLQLSLEDAFQECLYALCQATRTYDPSKGRFSTWAILCAENRLKLLARDKRRREEKGVELLGRSLGSPDSDFDTDYELLLATQPAVGSDVEDLVSDLVDHERALNMLSPKERMVVKMRQDNYSQSEIARAIRLSQAQVCRISRKAARKLAEVYHLPIPKRATTMRPSSVKK